MSTEVTQEISIIDRSVDVFKSGGPILLANQQRSATAVAIGKKIFSEIAEKGMSPELDERAMKYLVNCSTALKQENENRSAITQLMDEIKKMFTSAEALIDVKKEGTYASLIQSERNKYAKEVAEEKKRKEEQARIKAEKDKEAIEIKSTIEIRMFEYYSAFLGNAKTKMLNNFNALTLETISAAKDSLETWSPEYPIDHLPNFKMANFSKYHSNEEVLAFKNAVIDIKYPEFKSNYAAEMNLHKQEIIDRIPSKIAELQEAAEREKQIAAAKDQAEKDRLEQEKIKAQQEAQRREEEEQRKIAQEQEEARKAAELELAVKAEGEKTMVMFEQESASATDVAAPETRAGFEIEVTHQAGYVQLFTLWFEQEGKNLSLDKIEKTSFGQIKTWAEKLAHKTSEKIESKFLIYHDSYKAVNRKAK